MVPKPSTAPTAKSTENDADVVSEKVPACFFKDVEAELSALKSS